MPVLTLDRFPAGLIASGLAALLAAATVMPCAAGGMQRSAATIAPTPMREEGPAWSELPPAQRMALQPLEREWHTHSAATKRKWIDMAQRLPRMSPDDRARVEARMSAWAAMTPGQRAQARLQFKEAEQVAPKGRREQWEAYQALSPERKQQLARSPRGADRPRPDRTAADVGQQKSNIVPNPALAARPKAVAPAVVRAAPGATTTLMSKRPSPPPHEQAGLPKIVGTPNFVDPVTLLPRRGPQGAAVTAATASTPLPRP